MNYKEQFITWMLNDIRSKMKTTPELFIETNPMSCYNHSNMLDQLIYYYPDFFSEKCIKMLKDFEGGSIAEIYWENTMEAWIDEAELSADNYCNEEGYEIESVEWYEAKHDYFDNFNIGFYIYESYIEKIWRMNGETTNFYYDNYKASQLKNPFDTYFITIFEANLKKSMPELIVKSRNELIENILELV